MPTDKHPLKVFLCHAHADRDAVYALYTRLIKDGVHAWLDKEKLLPGQDWEYEIRKAVRESDVIIVCLSKQFNQAGFRQKEVRWALDTAMEKPEGEIFIIPARLEECDTLESLRKWHWVDLFEKNGYRKLTLALAIHAEKVNAVFGENHQYMEELAMLGDKLLKERDFSRAVPNLIVALQMSRDLDDKKAEVEMLKKLASAYESMGEFDSAEKLHQQALSLN